MSFPRLSHQIRTIKTDLLELMIPLGSESWSYPLLDELHLAQEHLDKALEVAKEKEAPEVAAKIQKAQKAFEQESEEMCRRILGQGHE